MHQLGEFAPFHVCTGSVPWPSRIAHTTVGPAHRRAPSRCEPKLHTATAVETDRRALRSASRRSGAYAFSAIGNVNLNAVHVAIHRMDCSLELHAVSAANCNHAHAQDRLRDGSVGGPRRMRCA